MRSFGAHCHVVLYLTATLQGRTCEFFLEMKCVPHAQCWTTSAKISASDLFLLRDLHSIVLYSTILLGPSGKEKHRSYGKPQLNNATLCQAELADVGTQRWVSVDASLSTYSEASLDRLLTSSAHLRLLTRTAWAKDKAKQPPIPQFKRQHEGHAAFNWEVGSCAGPAWPGFFHSNGQCRGSR